MLSATAAAEPPEDPPATLAVSRGLRTGPYMLFSLLAPCPNASQLFFPSKTPPCFLVGAFNDKSVHPSNSLRFYEALLEKGVVTSFHVFPQGGHSIGVGNNPGSTALWTPLCEEWMREMGLIESMR